MRFIDADEIDFNEVFKGQSDFAKNTREAAQSLIDEQPTAYDVDKVVERLGELNDNEFTYGKVISIIKAGGVNE